MTAAVQDLTQYVGKKVSITLTDKTEAGDPTAPFDATIEAADGDNAVIFKRKGKVNIEMVLAHRVAGVELIEKADDELKARRVDPQEVAGVKRHLVTYHGYSLSQVNPMKPEEALSFHENIDHNDMGHFHAPRPEKKDPKVKETSASNPEPTEY